MKEIVELTEEYEKIDFLDDAYSGAMGKLSELEDIQQNYDGCIVAIGNPEIREKLFYKMKNPVTLIHQKVVISKSTSIGQGCMIEANTSINANAVVKDGSYICSGAVVNHDAQISEFCQVDCNSVITAGAVLPKGIKLNSCSVWQAPVVVKPNEAADSFFSSYAN